MTMFSRTAARLLCGAIGFVVVGVPATATAQALVAKDAEPGSPAPVADPADPATPPAGQDETIVVTGANTRSVTQVTGVDMQKILPGVRPAKGAPDVAGRHFPHR